MRYELRQQDDKFFHVESGHCAGYVVPLKSGKGFSVHRTMTISANERDKIGVIKSIGEALPKLTDYYERNWPQWKRTREGQFDTDAGYTMYTAYIKWSFYGVFTVKQPRRRTMDCHSLYRCATARWQGSNIRNGGDSATRGRFARARRLCEFFSATR